jgi:hypothetical protein
LDLAARRIQPPLPAGVAETVPDLWGTFPANPQDLERVRGEARGDAKNVLAEVARRGPTGLDRREITGYSDNLFERYASGLLRGTLREWRTATFVPQYSQSAAAVNVFDELSVEAMWDAAVLAKQRPLVLARTPEWNEPVDLTPLTQETFDPAAVEAFMKKMEAVAPTRTFEEALGGPRFRNRCRRWSWEEAKHVLHTFAAYPSEEPDHLVSVPLRSKLFPQAVAAHQPLTTGELLDMAFSAVHLRELALWLPSEMPVLVQLNLDQAGGIQALFMPDRLMQNPEQVTGELKGLIDAYLALRERGYPTFIAFEELGFRLRAGLSI